MKTKLHFEMWLENGIFPLTAKVLTILTINKMTSPVTSPLSHSLPLQSSALPLKHYR